MAHHVLKTWPEFFLPVSLGLKTFELRRDDRGYAVGDTLELLCWDPALERETSTYRLTRLVTHLLRGPAFGVEEGFCILSLAITGVTTVGGG